MKRDYLKGTSSPSSMGECGWEGGGSSSTTGLEVEAEQRGAPSLDGGIRNRVDGPMSREEGRRS